MPDAQGYYFASEAIAALDEEGRIVGGVYCGAGCHNGRELGVVRESSLGLVFDAADPTATSLPKEIIELVYGDAFLPIKEGAQGRTLVLLQQQRRPGADEPAVICGAHGRLLPVDLLQTVQRRKRGVARILATPSGTL